MSTTIHHFVVNASVTNTDFDQHINTQDSEGQLSSGDYGATLVSLQEEIKHLADKMNNLNHEKSPPRLSQSSLSNGYFHQSSMQKRL